MNQRTKCPWLKKAGIKILSKHNFNAGFVLTDVKAGFITVGVGS